ncbi:hypothetical protein GS492_25090 [Rhodococcus hoagii]|nr:hypothetical protein [Prescottella equi]NKR75888.1 hypothetical protein [Prescottella equi]
MTDTITPEPTADDYRAAEKVLRAARFGGFRGGYDDEADWCKEEAARLEAESARDEYAQKIGELARDSFTSCPDSFEVADRIVGKILLEQLAADGRLLPEGATDLLPCDRCNGSGSEPAVSVPDSGDYCQHPDCADTNWQGRNRKHMRGGRCPSVPVPDGGPDGTPEKPWPTWQDVPEGVKYSSARYTYLRPCVNLRGHRYFITDDGAQILSGVPDSEMAERAPFVRVDGDQA